MDRDTRNRIYQQKQHEKEMLLYFRGLIQTMDSITLDRKFSILMYLDRSLRQLDREILQVMPILPPPPPQLNFGYR